MSVEGGVAAVGARGGRVKFPRVRGDVWVDVISAFAATAGRAEVVFFLVGVRCHGEPASMAVEAADVTAAETGDEHAFDDFAADDAGESEREGLFWFAVGAGEGRGCYALYVALGDCFGECFGCEDGVL